MLYILNPELTIKIEIIFLLISTCNNVIRCFTNSGNNLCCINVCVFISYDRIHDI